MSYTVTKTISVEYTDHEYTKSGDSISVYEVTRHKDVDINVHVDTEPFDASVDNCAHQVTGLTEAIVGFKTANVLSKQRSTAAIVDRTTNGFMQLIEQNINMQTAGLDADMNALAGELMQQCKELDHKHQVMTGDYNRIKSRYTALFDDLNKELTRRITFLMKPCFDFVKQVKQEQDRRIGSELLSTATLGCRENESVKTAIQASKVKQNATALISAAKNYVASRIALDEMVNFVSVDGNESKGYYAPVVLMHQKDDCSEGDRVVLNASMDRNGSVEAQLRNRMNTMSATGLPADARGRIDDFFIQRMNEWNDGSPRSRRVADMLMALYGNTELISYANK